MAALNEPNDAELIAASSPAPALPPDDWTALEPMIDALLDAAPGDRVALLTELSAGDAVRHARLTALLAECEAKLPILERPAEERFDTLLVPEEEIALPGVLGDRYKIERELGQGGMARVYLALDLKHSRNVAVKVIRPELAASLGRERFLREIGIAARLSHPNIVPLYDSGDANGVLYFVMPYESGQSLRQRLDRSKPLPASEYVSVLRDVARALAYAHEQGVVHRDVKPDNVMLSGGAAVVTDFGIAKAVSIAQGASGNTTTLTQSGSGIGTPTYMAPEQAVGDPTTDHRADLYAFGCLAYELISGAPPFHDLSIHQLVAAHVATPPVPLLTVQPDVPESIAIVVMQCLAKDPSERPQSADQILEAFERASAIGAPRGVATPHSNPSADEVSQQSGSGAHTSMRPAPPPGRSRRAVALAGLLLLAGSGYAVWRARAAGLIGPTPDMSVAMLPMESVGGDSIQRELADGLSDEVATALVHEAGVRVMSRRGVGNYRGKRDLDFATVGRELGARFLVSGQLRVLNGKTTVGATLHDASDGSILWKESYVQREADLDVLRDSISHGIATVLRAKSGLRAPAAIARRARPVDPEAYRRFILGQRALDRRGQSIQASIDNFEAAIAIDSGYAEAYAGLSLAYALKPYFSSSSVADVETRVRTAASRALRLDSTLAPAHVAMGLLLEHTYHWDSAGVEFATALRLRNSTDVEPLVQYGRYFVSRGRAREAMPQFMMARRIEPASALVSSWVSGAFYFEGRLDSAMVENTRAFQNDSNSATTLLFGAEIQLRAGKTAAARGLAQRLNPRNPGIDLFVLAAVGDSALARQRLDAAAARAPNNTHYWHWRAMLALGTADTAAALTAFEKATDAGDLWPFRVHIIDPIMTPLWAAPRFRALLRRIGLGELRLPPPVIN